MGEYIMVDRKLEQEIRIVGLRDKIARKESQLASAEERREELNQAKTSRYVKDSTARMLETAQVVGLGLVGGAIGAMVGQGTEMAEMGFVAGTTLGALSGAGASIINHIAYKKKIASNKINDFKKYLNDKKIARLKRNIFDLQCEKEKVSDPVMY